jgi:tyrosine-protein kinase Etk/Wzc
MIEPQKNQTIIDEEGELLDYFIVLAKYSRMIVYTSAAVAVCTYLILFILPNKYTAATRLLPPHQNMTLSAQLLNSIGGGPGTPGRPVGGLGGGEMAASLLGLKSPSDLYAAMLTGNPVYDRIIERFNLRQLYNEKDIESTRKALSKKTKIGVDKKSGMIIIEVTDKDPKRAAEMANAFSDELDKLVQGLAAQEARGRLTFLEKERVETSQNLIKAENALRSFSEANNVLQIDTQTKGALEYIARLRAEIDAKEVQIKVMLQQATLNNYDVVRMETQVKGLKEKLKTAESQVEQGSVGDVLLATSKVPTLGLKYLRLYREVKFQDSLYQFYIKMVELARIDMVKDMAVVQQEGRASPPERRSNLRLLPALFAGIGTFLLLSLAAIIRENTENANSAKKNLRLEQLSTYGQQWRQDARTLLFWLRKR